MKHSALVPLATFPDIIATSSLGTVADFAGRIGCDIHAVAYLARFPKVANALSRMLLDVPEMIRDAEAKSRAGAEDLLSGLRAVAKSAGVGFEGEMRAAGPDFAGDIAAEEARYFDLSLIPVPPGHEPSRLMAEGVVFGSGRPAILLPAAAESWNPRRAVIAWDGSRVAARAVADALALLGTMDKVTIVSVLNEKPLPAEDLGDRLAARLVARGVPATALPLELEDQPIGMTLQDFAVGEEAGLLVMGAYGHTRLRDFVLGGATKAILEDLRLPVLMSH